MRDGFGKISLQKYTWTRLTKGSRRESIENESQFLRSTFEIILNFTQSFFTILRSASAEADTLAQSKNELKSCLTKQLTRVQLRFCDLISFVRDFKITFSQEYVLTFF